MRAPPFFRHHSARGGVVDRVAIEVDEAQGYERATYDIFSCASVRGLFFRRRLDRRLLPLAVGTMGGPVVIDITLGGDTPVGAHYTQRARLSVYG